MSTTVGLRAAERRSRNQLRKEAYNLRKELGLIDEENFPIMNVLEFVLPRLYPDFSLEPVEDKELPGRMAETFPEQKLIRVKESVYQAACEGNGWARMVMAHELGHLLLHNSQTTSFACMDKSSRIPPEIDPEKQADIFAAELLAPIHLIANSNPYLIAKHCGVSRSAAKIQLRVALKVKRRHQNKHHEKEKRLSPSELNR